MIIEVVSVTSFLLLYQFVNPVKLVKMPDKLVDFVSHVFINSVEELMINKTTSRSPIMHVGWPQYNYSYKA